MMEEEGVVVAIEEGVARVRMSRGSRCEGCRACSLLGGEPELELPATEGLEVGAKVLVEIPEQGSWLSPVLLFALPILALVGGVVVGEQWRPAGLGGESASLVLGFGGLVLVFLVAVVIDRAFVRGRQPQPRIARVLGAGEQ